MTKKVEPLGSACLIIDVRLEMSLDDDYEGVSKLGAAYVKDGTDGRDLPPRCNTWRQETGEASSQISIRMFLQLAGVTQASTRRKSPANQATPSKTSPGRVSSWSQLDVKCSNWNDGADRDEGAAERMLSSNTAFINCALSGTLSSRVLTC